MRWKFLEFSLSAKKINAKQCSSIFGEFAVISASIKDMNNVGMEIAVILCLILQYSQYAM
jgi:hypothetical protein